MSAIGNQTGVKGWNPTFTLEIYNCTLGFRKNDSVEDVETESIGFDIVIWTLLCPMVILSNLLLFGVAHYERFGGDPQKRSLGNRLVFQASFSLIGLNSIRTITFLLMR